MNKEKSTCVCLTSQQRLQGQFIHNLKLSGLKKILKKSVAIGQISHFVQYFYKATEKLLDELKKAQHIQTQCVKNCDWCCYLQTSATMAEIFYLARYIRQSFSTLDVLELIERAKLASELAEHRNATQHHEKNIPCCLLKNGHCEAYLARPMACQIHHSMNSKICQCDFERPDTFYDNLTEEPRLVSAGAFLVERFNKTLVSCQLSTHRYELNQALLNVLENPALEGIWFSMGDVPVQKGLIHE